jgi:hypothetical protein
MNQKEYQELMVSLKSVTDRAGFLSKLIPAIPPYTPQVDLGLAQKNALKDLDETWDKFKLKAKALNAWADDPKQTQFKV